MSNDYENQQYHRKQSIAELERRGFKEHELQWLWRGPNCFTRKYDSGEVTAAICDALTGEGQTAWPGDGTSCVEQMIRLQWDRAEKAQARIAKALNVIDESGWIDGGHHKQWVIDQILRALTDDKYAEFVQYLENDGGEWDEGIAP